MPGLYCAARFRGQENGNSGCEVSGYLAGHSAASALPRSSAWIVVILALIVVCSVFLWIPVLADRVKAALNRMAPQLAPRIFVTGLAALVAGLVVHVTVLAVTGGCLIGGLVLAVVLNEY
jgi:hypothetical protein